MVNLVTYIIHGSCRVGSSFLYKCQVLGRIFIIFCCFLAYFFGSISAWDFLFFLFCTFIHSSWFGIDESSRYVWDLFLDSSGQNGFKKQMSKIVAWSLAPVFLILLMEETPLTSLSQYLKAFFTSQVIVGDLWSINSILEIFRYLEPKKISRYKILSYSPGAVGGSHGREASEKIKTRCDVMWREWKSNWDHKQIFWVHVC